MSLDNKKRANEIDSIDKEVTQPEDELDAKVSKWTFFKAGWRPALGWISVIIVLYSFVIHPAIIWWVVLNGFKVTVPAIDSAALLNLVAIVIGVGAMRTYEKVRFNEDDDYSRGSSRRRSSRSRPRADDEDDEIFN